MRYLFFICVSSLYLWANAHVFIYHRFDDPKRASTNTSLEELRKEFDYFKNNGYEVVPLKKIVDKVNRNQKVPDNWVALTIDDAYKSFYTKALPIFKEYGYPFSLYVYVEATTKRYGDYMTWEEVKEASKYGEIGLHSYAHPHLTHLTKKEIISDTRKAMKIFEKKMGFKPISYAHPYGEFDERVLEAIKTFGFEYVLNQSTGSVNQESDPSNINRIALVGEVNLKQKLRYKSLNVEWIEPKEFPSDGILRKVRAKVNKDISTIKLYITSEGWIENIKVKNGIVDVDLNVYLKRARTRVSLSTDYFMISSQMIVKDKNKIKTKGYANAK